jgi:lipoprotein NlpD
VRRRSFSILLVAVVSLALVAGCMTRRPAPVVDRSPPRTAKPPPVAPAPAPRTPAPTEPGVVVSPITGTAPIVGRPLKGDGPSDPPPASAPVIPPSAPAVLSGTLKTEPKGVRLPYSEANLAALQREPIAGSPKPEASPLPQQPAPVVPPTAKLEVPPAAKPEAPPAAKTEPESAEERIDWAWPASGNVISTFNGGGSKGVDIAGRLGDPVQASAAGRVVYSGEGIPAYGKLVIIRHSTVYLSAYAHNRTIVVKEGQNVTKGQKIAELGSTGADQAKLHFEIRRFGKPVDPLQYLPSRP